MNIYAARLLLKVEKFPEAQKIYRKLVSENPDSLDFITSLLESQRLNKDLPSEYEQTLDILEDLETTYPRSHASTHLALECAQGPRFIALLELYLIKGFRKGVPSLFNTLKDLMKDHKKKETIYQTVTEFASNLSKDGKLKAGAESKLFHYFS